MHGSLARRTTGPRGFRTTRSSCHTDLLADPGQPQATILILEGSFTDVYVEPDPGTLLLCYRRPSAGRWQQVSQTLGPISVVHLFPKVWLTDLMKDWVPIIHFLTTVDAVCY